MGLSGEDKLHRAFFVGHEGRVNGTVAIALDGATGAIVELGTHDELVGHEGRYASMYATWVAHGGAE